MNDLDFELSRPTRVKSNGAVGLPIYDFLLMSNSNDMPISHRLAVIAIWKFSSYLLSLVQTFGQPLTHPYPHVFFLFFFFLAKIECPPSPPRLRGKASTQNKVDRFETF